MSNNQRLKQQAKKIFTESKVVDCPALSIFGALFLVGADKEE